MAVVKGTTSSKSPTKKKKSTTVSRANTDPTKAPKKPRTQGPVKVGSSPALKTPTKKAVKAINTATGETTARYAPRSKAAVVVKPLPPKHAKKYNASGLAFTGIQRSRESIETSRGMGRVVEVKKSLDPWNKKRVTTHELGHAIGGLTDRYDKPSPVQKSKGIKYAKKSIMAYGTTITKAGSSRIRRSAGVGRVPTKYVKRKKSK